MIPTDASSSLSPPLHHGRFTYMLIRDETKKHLEAGRLVPVKSRAFWTSEPRCFLLEKELDTELRLERTEPKDINRWAKLEADMSHFVEGGYINWNLMKWLDPQKQEVWEFKSVRPKPSIRVFGRFAEPDVFVGTNYQLRNKMKGKWSQEFWNEIGECEKIWADLFKSDPLRGKIYSDYITKNADKRVGV